MNGFLRLGLSRVQGRARALLGAVRRPAAITPDHLAIVARLYRAAYGRQADDAGLRYYAERLGASETLLDVARAFAGSDEFRRAHGPGETALAAYHRHVFGAAPSLPAGGDDPAKQLAAFVQSPDVLAALPLSPALFGEGLKLDDDVMYGIWAASEIALDEADRALIRAAVAGMPHLPRISVVLTLPERGGSLRGREAVLRQLYPEWELCLVVPERMAPGLRDSVADDRRLRLATSRPEALAATTGRFVCFLPADAVLAEQALFEVAVAAAAQPDATLIYTDDDVMDGQGRLSRPRFKPDFDPDLLAATDYIGEAAFHRRDALGAPPVRPFHIPAVLVHFAGAPVQPVHAMPAAPETGLPKVSIIVPTRDRATLLRTCVEGLLARTAYPDFEVIIVDNDSVEPATAGLLAELACNPAVRVLPCPGPFNWSAMNNRASEIAAGEILVMLNNDIDVIDPGWLRELVRHALRPEVGAVGAKLLYPDQRVQHAGIAIGPDGRSKHLFRFAGRNDAGYLRCLAHTRSVAAATGACLATRRAVLREVGGFDEDMPLTLNDVEFCLRVRARGYRIICSSMAALWHLEQATRGPDDTPERRARLEAEEKRLCARWGEFADVDPFVNINLEATEDGIVLPAKPRRRRPWR